MILIIVKSCCPVCGIHTSVELTPYELNNYKNKGIIPYGFYEETVCDCCKDDGFKLNEKYKEIYQCVLICG